MLEDGRPQLEQQRPQLRERREDVAAVTWLTGKGAEQRLHAVMYGGDGAGDAGVSDEADKQSKVPLRAVLWLSFGLFLPRRSSNGGERALAANAPAAQVS